MKKMLLPIYLLALVVWTSQSVRGYQEGKGKESFRQLVRQLQAFDCDDRASAAKALGLLDDKRATRPLIRALRDECLDARSEVAIALGYLRDKRAYYPLLEMLDDPSVEMRVSSVVALGELRDKRAVLPLIRRLRDNNADVRMQAAFSFSKIRDKRAAAPLISLLRSDPDANTRAAAAFSLRGWEKAFQPLIDALSDKEDNVLSAALDSLSLFRDKRAIPAIENLAATSPDDSIRALAAKVAEKLKRGLSLYDP